MSSLSVDPSRVYHFVHSSAKSAANAASQMKNIAFRISQKALLFFKANWWWICGNKLKSTGVLISSVAVSLLIYQLFQAIKKNGEQSAKTPPVSPSSASSSSEPLSPEQLNDFLISYGRVADHQDSSANKKYGLFQAFTESSKREVFDKIDKAIENLKQSPLKTLKTPTIFRDNWDRLHWHLGVSRIGQTDDFALIGLSEKLQPENQYENRCEKIISQIRDDEEEQKQS